MRLCSTALLLPACLVLTSCSGGLSTGPCTTNCPSGNATVSVVLTATPPPPSLHLSLQAFRATIVGLSFTPSSGGSPVSVNLNSTAYVAEFTRVTSDSTLLAAKFQVPADTYNRVTVTFSAPSVTFCTQANPGVPGCAAGTLRALTGSPAAGTASVSTSLTFAANQKTGFALNIDIGRTLSLNGQTVTGADLTVVDAFSVSALPPPSASTDLASGQLAHLDDVMGLVTAVTSNSVTVQTSTRGAVTATSNSSTVYSSFCSTPSVGCVKVNDAAVIDAILNTDGTIALAFLEPLSSGTSDLIEGVVTGIPDSVASQFTVVATDSLFPATNSVLNGQLNLGDQVLVTLNAAAQPFVIVDKGLGQTLPANSFEGANSVSALQPGMTVVFTVAAYTPQSSTAPGSAETASLALRFSRVTGTVVAATSPDFSGNTFAPLFGIANNQQFRTTSGRLSLDGVSDLTSMASGSTFSASALYLGLPAGPAFAAQTVREH
jgi:hypothetical protein